MYCSDCGNQVSEKMRFCPRCGAQTGAVLRQNPGDQGGVNPWAPQQNAGGQMGQNPWHPQQNGPCPAVGARSKIKEQDKAYGPVATALFRIVFVLGWGLFGLSVLMSLTFFSGESPDLVARIMVFSWGVGIFCGIITLGINMRKGAILLVASGGCWAVVSSLLFLLGRAAGVL